jgi:hypothetical protein
MGVDLTSSLPLTPSVGQEAQLAHVRRRLLDPACRLLVLVGPGPWSIYGPVGCGSLLA